MGKMVYVEATPAMNSSVYGLAEHPHVTLAFIGPAAENPFQSRWLDTLIRTARRFAPFRAEVTGCINFKRGDVDALLLEAKPLQAIYEVLHGTGHYPEPTFPHFVPHLSVSSDLNIGQSFWPVAIPFTMLTLVDGNRRHTVSLNGRD